MNLVEFLQELFLNGVKLWLDGGQLRSGGSHDVLTPHVITQLKQHKVSSVVGVYDQLVPTLSSSVPNALKDFVKEFTIKTGHTGLILNHQDSLAKILAL